MRALPKFAKFLGRFAAILLAAALLLLPLNAWALGICRFPKLKPVILKDMGPCRFDLDFMRFAGEPVDEARCLLTPVEKFGKLGAPIETLPDILTERVGGSFGLPDREALRALLRERGLEWEFGETLSRPVAHAHDGDPISTSARYLVIHDTSAPNFRGRPWPNDIDRDGSINNLARYQCDNKIERAHVFINRTGKILLAHDFEVPWRATKFEMAVQFASALKGLFLHVELIQPRRREPRRGWNNDFQAPMPGFSRAQYDALALTYTVASLRAGFWLIPAFHGVLDEGIYDKHDDPQNFQLQAFVESLEKLLVELQKLAALPSK